MTITTVLVVYTTLVATLALGISLLILRALPLDSLGATKGDAHTGQSSGPEVGSAAPSFTARTRTAEELDSTELEGRSHLFAFLSSSCAGCLTALPSLLGYASQLRDPHQVITVIVGDFNERAVEIEQRVAGMATVVSEPDGGPIATAYQITLFPSYVLVSETGTVLATSSSVLELPLPQRQ